MSVHVSIRKGEFRDSVVLMNASQRLREAEGVLDALVVMGTDSNKEVLRDLGLLTTGAEEATGNDLVVAMKTENPTIARSILGNLDSYFAQQGAVEHPKHYPSLDSALEDVTGANLALISVPGEYAAGEARRALRRGLHTLLFSDNMSLEEEITLKRLATELGLLLMGPDCGVCNLGGAALALASIVGRGPIGIVGASGAGTQEVATLVERAGLGVSHAIGTGGRDLHEAVGALTMAGSLAALDSDASTDVIVLVGKAPSGSVTSKLCETIQGCGKAVVACFLGADPEPWVKSGAYFASSMDSAAQLAVALARREPTEVRTFDLPDAEVVGLADTLRATLQPGQKYLRGIFGAGTFVAQAQAIIGELMSPIHSNSPFAGGQRLEDVRESKGHCVLDLGDEALTRGRAHPVIDPLPYRLRILKEFQDPETAVLLLDVILGPALHPDPAEYIVTALREARDASGRSPVVVASVCGTHRDPQNAPAQEQKLRAAGVTVMPSSAQAARLAGLILSQRPADEALAVLARREPFPQPVSRQPERGLTSSRRIAELLGGGLKVINVGVDVMARALRMQGVDVAEVSWSPPAGGDPRIARLLWRLG